MTTNKPKRTRRATRRAQDTIPREDFAALLRVAAWMEDRMSTLAESGAFEHDEDGGAEMSELICDAQDVLSRFGALRVPCVVMIENRAKKRPGKPSALDS